LDESWFINPFQNQMIQCKALNSIPRTKKKKKKKDLQGFTFDTVSGDSNGIII
jgi:hypothetical protein